MTSLFDTSFCLNSHTRSTPVGLSYERCRLPYYFFASLRLAPTFLRTVSNFYQGIEVMEIFHPCKSLNKISYGFVGIVLPE